MGGMQHPGGWVVASVMMIAVLGGPAAAQRTVVEADATFSVGYTQLTQARFQADPNAAPEDVPDETTSELFTQLRPGIALQTGSPRLTWRAAYVFAGNLSLTGEQLGAYSNQANGSLAAELSKFTTLTVAASIAQGGTSFLLAQRPADAGDTQIRAPGNPDLISASLLESVAWEARKHLTIGHSVTANLSAPQDDFSERNSAWSATLSLDRVFERDTLGAEARASISWLRPLRQGTHLYRSTSNGLLARWNHDFSVSWNGLVTAGIEQVYTDTGSQPLAFLPAASATVRYAAYNTVAALDFSHGTATNLQVGAISLTDKITARGIITLDPRVFRTLAFSAGFLHNEPLGEVDAAVAAGTGNAVQGDAGFTTAITRNVLGSVRYSVAYQFGQGGNLQPTLAHIVFIGITGTYRNAEGPTRALPARGNRVDGSDAEGFPVIVDKPTL
jgi:hypothetical protein